MGMSDHAACVNKTCPRRAECARYRMKWGYRQSVASFVADRCGYFVAVDQSPWPCVSVAAADERPLAVGDAG